jgi:hypothetical protein
LKDIAINEINQPWTKNINNGKIVNACPSLDQGLTPKQLIRTQNPFGFDHYSIVPLFHHSIGVAIFKILLE